MPLPPVLAHFFDNSSELPALEKNVLCARNRKPSTNQKSTSSNKTLRFRNGTAGIHCVKEWQPRLAGLARDGTAAKVLLRHANLATTTRHCVKDDPENTLSAMELLEKLCKVQRRVP